MIDLPTSQLNPARSGVTARKFALMASVVAGVGVAVYGFNPSADKAELFTSPAHAQVNTDVSKVAQPIGFADIVERVKPSVISVKIRMKEKAEADGEEWSFQPGSPMERFFRRFGGPDGLPPGMRGRRGHGLVTGQGSGFFISADGYAVTNNHVVDGADKVEVTTDEGKTFTAKVIGTDPRTDIALIKIEGGSNFPFARLSDDKVRIGDWVLAVGNPFGLGGSVTAGIVSASGRDIGTGPYDDFIQIDAPVNKGNSGGPAFNMKGDVIGVNTAIYSPSGGSVGIAFSIPANTVKSVVAQLKDKGSVSRGWIGVQIQPVTSDIADSLGLKKAEGALVAEPQPNGPAAKAGIQSGDVITAVNGDHVRDARELARTIGSFAPGTSIKLNILHKGTDKVVNLTLGTLPNTVEARADLYGDRELIARQRRSEAWLERCAGGVSGGCWNGGCCCRRRGSKRRCGRSRVQGRRRDFGSCGKECVQLGRRTRGNQSGTCGREEQRSDAGSHWKHGAIHRDTDREGLSLMPKSESGF